MTGTGPVMPPLALTMGDPAGVGLELSIAAWWTLRETGPAFFMIDDPHRVAAGPNAAPVRVIQTPADASAVFAGALPVLPVGHDVPYTPGQPSTATADAVRASIEQAVAFALSGEAAGVVTNPIHKKVLQDAGFQFPGHTEFLGALTAAKLMPDGFSRKPVMMIAGPKLRVVPVTIHTPLSRVPTQLTTQEIVTTARIAANALRRSFAIAQPRLAVAGLNPHAGEGGALGGEDAAIVAPAVEALQALGIDARGPLPADTMFHEEARAEYDAAICMYHDQALIPAKALDFHSAVNCTFGIPIVRTSPDHGVALDIAGKSVARPDSLIAALRLAADMAVKRAEYDAIHAL